MSKTIRVRIAVAVDTKGWAVAGGFQKRTMREDQSPESLLTDWDMLGDLGEGDARVRFCWVEADVPMPEPESAPVIEGEVTP